MPSIVNNARMFQGFVNEPPTIVTGQVAVDVSQMHEVTAVVRNITLGTLHYIVRPSYGEGIFHAPLAEGDIASNEYVPVLIPRYMREVQLEVTLISAPNPPTALRAELYGCGIAI